MRSDWRSALPAARTLQQALQACPLLAAPRRISPEEAERGAVALVEAGFRMIEVPLNSPPAEAISPAVLKAWRAVFAQEIPLVPSGIQNTRGATCTLPL
jgi:hypothetical protein